MGSFVSSRKNCLPEWWFASYVFVFVMFTAVVALLVAAGTESTAAAAVPVVLSGAAVSALRRLRVSGPHRQNS
ncbi:hypothetical protein ACGF5S_32755 [Nocardia nova]|uniref:hypothetical protein n=1 Tax=Nocardia nova TaxID=37330 RepID=UPI00371D1E3C